MARAKQTVERRQLGLMLRRFRREAGISQSQAARALQRDQTRVSSAEVGKGALGPDELTTLLDLYGVTGDDRETVLSLGAQARRRQRGPTYTDSLPGVFHRLADLQADAETIRFYEVGIIPGLIQSPEYVRALMEAAVGVWWESDDGEIEGRVNFRLEQQRRVLEAATPKELRFVITEDALHHPVGGRSVMRGQILHVLKLIEQQEKMTAQILPTGTPDNPALGGGFLLLDFETAPRCGVAEVVYGPCTYHDQVEDTSALARAFTRLEELALSPDDSSARLLSAYKEI